MYRHLIFWNKLYRSVGNVNYFLIVILLKMCSWEVQQQLFSTRNIHLLKILLISFTEQTNPTVLSTVGIFIILVNWLTFGILWLDLFWSIVNYFISQYKISVHDLWNLFGENSCICPLKIIYSVYFSKSFDNTICCVAFMLSTYTDRALFSVRFAYSLVNNNTDFLWPVPWFLGRVNFLIQRICSKFSSCFYSDLDLNTISDTFDISFDK